MSKCGKNKELAHGPQVSVSLIGKMESICFMQWGEKKKRHIVHISLLPHDCSRIFASLGITSQTLHVLVKISYNIVHWWISCGKWKNRDKNNRLVQLQNDDWLLLTSDFIDLF